jgi:hypothetical protein
MKRLEFEKLLSLLGHDLFSFAFILIPDDLQAGQLVVDAIGSFLISHNAKAITMAQSKIKINQSEVLFMKKELLRNVYELARKRYHQIKLSINEIENKNDFYSLDFDEKAVLYLKEKCDYNVDEVSVIVLKTRSETLGYLYGARIKMIEKIPFRVLNEVRV